MQKQKLQLQQQQQVAAAVAAAAQSQQVAGTQPATQVQSAQAAQANPQLTAVAAPRPGTVLTGTTVANLQVARLVNAPFFTSEATEAPPAGVRWTASSGKSSGCSSASERWRSRCQGHIGSRKTPVS